MKEATAASPPRLDPPANDQGLAFDALEQTLHSSGPESALERLIVHLDDTADYRSLLDALVLKARHELGLPLVQVGPLTSLPEPIRTQFEEKYVEAIRQVGSKLLTAGEIATAWPYFRAIGEPQLLAAALDAYVPGDDVEQVSQIIDVAFNQGANPRRGFELILDHYGTCSSITALEQIPPGDEATRVACIERLVRHLHGQLVASVRADISQRGQPLPAEGTSIAGLVTGREWLFSDEAYHIDISHLSSTVRYSVLISDPGVLALAADLTEYGRRLSPRLQFEGTPPFERVFEDHRLYFRALLGQDVETAIAHFRDKLKAATEEDLEATMPAQVLVNLLIRLDRIDEAIDLASAHLAHLPESALNCPGLPELCQRARRPDRLATIARQQGNLVHFLAALLESADA